VIFASFNNTKSDDFKPYVFKSSDKGKSWVSITGDLPENGSVHAVIQDPVDPNLLFVGTEFSFFFSLDGGKTWVKFANGLPTIPVRDIKIQEREKDLVIATFGRGFYILDDYSSLRGLTFEKLDSTKAMIFPVKDALMYIQDGDRYGQGSAVFKAKNPEFGANITYYVKEVPKTLKQKRLKEEKELFKEGKPIPTPTKEQLDAEKNETGPYLIFSIKDKTGTEVRKLFAKGGKGIQKINWDLRYEATGPVRLKGDKYNPTAETRSGMLAMPGTYTVELNLFHNGESTLLAGPVPLTAKVLHNVTLPANREELVAFQDKVSQMWRVFSGVEEYFDELDKRTAYIQQAIQQTNGTSIEMKNDAQKVKEELEAIDFIFNGTPAAASWEEVPPEIMPLSVRYQEIAWGMWGSTSSPTATMKMNYNIIMEELPGIIDRLEGLSGDLDKLDAELDKLKAPYTPGRIPKM
jgi:hypothetical protein